MPNLSPLARLARVLAAPAAVFGLSSCTLSNLSPARVMTDQEKRAAAVTPTAPGSTPVAPIPLPEVAFGQALRVGGDLAITAKREGNGDSETWAVGTALINTPLPVGYAPPTPPGAIDLKRYPSLRRAEYTGTITPGLGMNFGFFPLFNHIKRRDIAMTSPVEMDYRGLMEPAADQPPAADPQLKPASTDKVPSDWTMSFLYRKQEQGPAGVDSKDARISVVDTPERLVVALGFQGGQGLGRVKKELDVLAEWLAADARWEPAGEPRALYYNGPDRRDRDKWGEVQLPVRPRRAAKPEAFRPETVRPEAVKPAPAATP